MDTQDRLIELMHEHLGASPRIVAEAENCDDAAIRPIPHLGADSLDMIEIVMACEDAFGIDIADAEANQFTDGEGDSIGALVSLIDAKLGRA